MSVNYLRIVYVGLRMQKKTLLTLICAVRDIILCFVATFGCCLAMTLAITCRFVHEIVTWLYLACSKKHVQQESVSQLQDYYNKEVCKADTQAETQACVCEMAGLSEVDLNQTHYRGALTITASVAYARAVENVKSERAENNAVKRSYSDNIAADPRAYAQGTWTASRVTWTGTKP